MKIMQYEKFCNLKKVGHQISATRTNSNLKNWIKTKVRQGKSAFWKG